MPFNLIKIAHHEIGPWRQDYQKQLGWSVIPDQQEAWFRLGQPYHLEEMGQQLGYVLVCQEPMLALPVPIISELYFCVNQTRIIRELIRKVIEAVKPSCILCRTDEPLIFPLLMDFHLPNQVLSTMYYLDEKPRWHEEAELSIIPSSMDEVDDVFPLYASVPTECGGIADQLALTKSLAAWQHYRLMAQGQLLAVGYLAPQGGRYVALFTIVAKLYRGQGYGRYLTTFIAQQAIVQQQLVIAVINHEEDINKQLIESIGSRIISHNIMFKTRQLMS